jgi:hypothetical protein
MVWVAYSGPPEVALWERRDERVARRRSEPNVPDRDVVVLSDRLEPPEQAPQS